MSVRGKILLVIIATVSLAVVVIFAISDLVFMNGFQKIEQKNTLQMAQRSERALSDRVNSLKTLNHDWAEYSG
jgi:sensor domain CHASE-containing protein